MTSQVLCGKLVVFGITAFALAAATDLESESLGLHSSGILFHIGIPRSATNPLKLKGSVQTVQSFWNGLGCDVVSLL